MNVTEQMNYALAWLWWSKLKEVRPSSRLGGCWQILKNEAEAVGLWRKGWLGQMFQEKLLDFAIA